MKITDSSNMGTVNHATENLQHRILNFSKYCSVITRRQRERYRARREREEQKSSGQPGWQDEGNMTDVDTLQ